mmetsp:Transcript_176/g.280  ORF Transcript_176/g.280 Transcript_176/m.280 type:complete len:88 (+) Transcript_176:818-1081(+)
MNGIMMEYQAITTLVVQRMRNAGALSLRMGTICFVPKVMPESCEPDPCVNGGECYTYDYYNFCSEFSNIFLCRCLDGFERPFSEIEV